MIESLEEALKATLLDFEYDADHPRLDVLVYHILLHIKLIELSPKSSSAFPIMRDYILNKGSQESFKAIPSAILGQPSNEELRNYATSFCKRLDKERNNNY